MEERQGGKKEGRKEGGCGYVTANTVGCTSVRGRRRGGDFNAKITGAPVKRTNDRWSSEHASLARRTLACHPRVCHATAVFATAAEETRVVAPSASLFLGTVLAAGRRTGHVPPTSARCARVIGDPFRGCDTASPVRRGVRPRRRRRSKPIRTDTDGRLVREIAGTLPNFVRDVVNYRYEAYIRVIDRKDIRGDVGKRELEIETYSRTRI